MQRSRCAFFDGVVPFEGWGTWRVDEELALLFARSWAAEAQASGEAEPARRAARMGRLLLLEKAWSETSQAGRRAIVLGVNELRRQAVADGRHADAIAAVRVLAQVQGAWLWLRPTRSSRQFALRPWSAEQFGDDSRWFKNAAMGPQREARIWHVRQAWPAAHHPRKPVREAYRPLLEEWRDGEDAILSTAAAYFLERAWTPEGAQETWPIPDALAWADAPDDPVERWLTPWAWSSIDDLVAEDRAALPEARDVPPTPDVFRPTDQEALWALQARGEQRKLVDWGSFDWVLPADDPVLLEVEAWLLAGGRLPELDLSDRHGWRRQSQRQLLWTSLVHRADALPGTSAEARATRALESVIAQTALREDRVWFGAMLSRLQLQLAGIRVRTALRAGRADLALPHAERVAAEELHSGWKRAITRIAEDIRRRRAERGLMGWGAHRASILDEEIDLLESHAAERDATFVRVAAADGLWTISQVGTWGQRSRAKRLLRDLAADSDERLALHAQTLLSQNYGRSRVSWDVRLSRAWDAVVGD